MNDGSIHNLNGLLCLLCLLWFTKHVMHRHTYKTRQGKWWEGPVDSWHLLFHEQMFVFMSVNKTRVQLNEANEEAPHLALRAKWTVRGATERTQWETVFYKIVRREVLIRVKTNMLGKADWRKWLKLLDDNGIFCFFNFINTFKWLRQEPVWAKGNISNKHHTPPS